MAALDCGGDAAAITGAVSAFFRSKVNDLSAESAADFGAKLEAKTGTVSLFFRPKENDVSAGSATVAFETGAATVLSGDDCLDAWPVLTLRDP